MMSRTLNSCTVLLFGSTVVAYTIYETADWLLRTHKEWCHHQCHPSRSLTTANRGAKPLPREEVSTYSSLKKRVQRVCPRRSQVHRVEVSGAVDGPLHLANPPRRSKFSKSCRRVARCLCCCFYLYSLRENEPAEIEPGIERHNQSSEIEIDDQSRKIERHDQITTEIVAEGLDREITIIPFEQKEAEKQRANNEEPKQPRRRTSTRAIAHERLQNARADEKWKETVYLTLKRLVYSLAGGTIIALTMFRGCTTRWSIIALGAGLGLGLSVRDASDGLKETTNPL